ncbi:sensor domain-containing protein [Vreelandella populi]|uniref:EAL domain-containing protein n=1 Tax=Vreelandella populi TaxID=2498858 RepID=A0A433LER2_9GAMM|nr:EAL domain-containing protein [Halomonas populi]RUR35458.1 EAL domain-containing protein [Halomonas populi]RUR47647.1 EAL domain-containing protein [Halomonas populi]RUR54488.1 EAL domain-containing protein [Halomonas populi]
MSIPTLFSLDDFPVGCMVTDNKRHVVYSNRYIEEYFGYSPHELLDADLFSLLSKASQIIYEAYIVPLIAREGYCDEIRLTLVTSAESLAPIVVSARHDSVYDRIFWSISSVSRSNQLFEKLTETKSLLEQKVSLLRTLKDTDPLTGLPNRAALTKYLDQEMLSRKRNGMAFAVAFVDLDGFKEINDRHGHHVGDKTLQLMAERLTGNLKSDDMVARFGGDEFVIFLKGCFSASLVEESLTRLVSKLAEPFKVDALPLNLSASIGVTLYPQAKDVEPGQLIRQADQAMYQAKLSGKNQVCLFNTDNEVVQKEKHSELLAIKAAMEFDQFELYYQPKINMRTGKVFGVEALIRWNHPVEGLKGPATFLPVLSNTPTGLALGRWVITTALCQQQIWVQKGLKLQVSVNIDGYHLQHPQFLRDLSAILSDFPNLPKQLFEIEVLETSTIEDVSHVSSVLNACRLMGIRISLDDFGTGYSSLSHLRDLPVDTLKIDRSFVKNMLTSSNDLAILKGVIGFAHAFGYGLVAEGVETLQHSQRLVELGCECGQGYYIAKPMPARAFPTWIDEWYQQACQEKYKNSFV